MHRNTCIPLKTYLRANFLNTPVLLSIENRNLGQVVKLPYQLIWEMATDTGAECPVQGLTPSCIPGPSPFHKEKERTLTAASSPQPRPLLPSPSPPSEGPS